MARSRTSIPSNPRTFRSRYPGRCELCGRPIEVGDRIAWVRNEYLAHEDCHADAVAANEADAAARAADPIAQADAVYWQQRADAHAAKAAKNDPCPF